MSLTGGPERPPTSSSMTNDMPTDSRSRADLRGVVARVGARIKTALDIAARTARAAKNEEPTFLVDLVSLTAELSWHCDKLRGEVQRLRSTVQQSSEKGDAAEGGGEARPADLHGRTAAFPADQLLAFLESTRATGVITFHTRDATTAFGVENGVVVHAISTNPSANSRLGELLIELGALQESELEQSLADCQQSGKRIGEHLVESGLLDVSALRAALDQQVRHILSQTLRMKDAHFSFYRHAKSHMKIQVSCRTTELLLDAARQSDEDRETSPQSTPEPTHLSTIASADANGLPAESSAPDDSAETNTPKE